MADMENLGIVSEHFSNAELRCKHGVNGCTQELVDALEAFRAEVSRRTGKSTAVVVNDAYRCQRCNDALPNAVPNSQHTLGRAADITVPGWTAAQLEEVALTMPAFKNGGIGRADLQRYIHVDVRPTVARWCYDRTGRQMPWQPVSKDARPGADEIPA